MIFEVCSIATTKTLGTPQDGSKQRQPQGGFKVAPRWPQDTPRRLQDGSKTAPRRAKTAPRRPRTLQDRPKTSQDHPKTLQDAPRSLQDARRPLEDDSRIRSKTLHDSSQCIAKATPPQDHSKRISHPDLGLDLVLKFEPGTSSGTSYYARYGNRSPSQSVPKFETDSIRSLATDLVPSQTWNPIYDTVRDLDPNQTCDWLPSLASNWYHIPYRLGANWSEIWCQVLYQMWYLIWCQI